ncbi:MAG TPA: carboxyl transferase domain-containing protein [Acidimicrobiales bacterium]
MTDADWERTLEDLATRRSRAEAMGGPERLARHRNGGKLDARARVEALLDAGSFFELGRLVGDVPADGVITGWGRIQGRSVVVVAEDFTTVAGSIGRGSHSKRIRAADLALQESIPLIMLLEGAGYRPGESPGGKSPVDLNLQAKCSGEVPLVTGVLGASAGHGALVAPMSDFTVMTSQAAIFTAGPPVVRESMGAEISKEELGGPSVALGSGLIHNLARDDSDALAQIRTYLSFFPSSAWSYPPSEPRAEGEESPIEELVRHIPRDGRRGYDMRKVIELVADERNWFEVQPHYGKAIVTALARLDGHPVAIVANQPQVMAGSVDADAADKAAHFITVADSFHLPLIFLSDNPGMLPGQKSEADGVLRSGARMYAAQAQATTVKINITMRKAYGFGSMVMAMASFERQSGIFGFPGATLGAMGASAMSRATGAGDETARQLRQLEDEASYNSAKWLGFDELIDPRDTRRVLLTVMGHSLNRRQKPPAPVLRKAITP